MSRVVLMFKPRFAPLVKSGQKRMTIRPIGKRRIESGMFADLREWTGRPYHSKQRKLAWGKIYQVTKVKIDSDGMILSDGVSDHRCDDMVTEAFAKQDGFKDAAEMLAWFQGEHGLPFEGRMIQWRTE